MKRKKTTHIIAEFLGWYGVAAILLAYILVSFGVIEGRDVTYQGLNATGSIGIIINSLTKKDYQPVILNVIWVFIAVIVLIQLLF